MHRNAAARCAGNRDVVPRFHPIRSAQPVTHRERRIEKFSRICSPNLAHFGDALASYARTPGRASARLPELIAHDAFQTRDRSIGRRPWFSQRSRRPAIGSRPETRFSSTVRPPKSASSNGRKKRTSSPEISGERHSANSYSPKPPLKTGTAQARENSAHRGRANNLDAAPSESRHLSDLPTMSSPSPKKSTPHAHISILSGGGKLTTMVVPR